MTNTTDLPSSSAADRVGMDTRDIMAIAANVISELDRKGSEWSPFFFIR
jgi:hypothetical protein